MSNKVWNKKQKGVYQLIAAVLSSLEGFEDQLKLICETFLYIYVYAHTVSVTKKATHNFDLKMCDDNF